MACLIRDFREEDAGKLADLTVRAIHEIGPSHYSPGQVDAWAARHPDARRFIERVASGHRIFVATDADDVPVAYALLEPDGHLDMLYCHPDHTRKGLGGELLAHAEAQATVSGVTRLYTEASELARAAFERAGYDLLDRRDFEIEGVAIHNYAMEKHLA